MDKIIIVEDQIILNDMLKNTISSVYDVVATTTDASELMDLCDLYKPNIVLTDVCTKNNANGISYAKKVKEKYGDDVKILVMTGIPEVSFLKQTKDANLDGFIYKNIDSDSLLYTLKSIIDGYKIFPNNTEFNKSHKLLDSLSSKEMEILRMLCGSYERDEIAKKLGISNGTLKNHISSILNKTKFDSISKLEVFCVANGYIVPMFDN